MRATAESLETIQARRAERARKDARARTERAPAEERDERPLHTLRPPQLVALRFRLEEQLAAVGSVTGRQLERLQGGLTGPPPDGAMADGQARLRLAFQDCLALLHAAALDSAQERVLRARYGGGGTPVLRERYRPAGAQIQGAGEDVIGPGPDGTVLVRGWESRLPSYQEIGEGEGLTARQVQRLLDTALEQVRFAMAERAHRASLEG